LIGAGAVLASALPWILTNVFGMSGGAPDIKLLGAGNEEIPISLSSAIPATVHLAFYIGAAVFFFAVLYTILTTKEYPPEDPEAFRRMKAEKGGPFHFIAEIGQGIRNMPRTMRRLAVVQFFTWFGLFCMWIYFIPSTATKVFGGRPLGDERPESVTPDAQQAGIAAIKSALVAARGGAGAIEAGAPAETLTLSEYMEKAKAAIQAGADADVRVSDLELENPVYTTTAAILAGGGDTESQAAAMQSRLAESQRYREGVEWGGLCFSVYNFIAFVFAFVLLGLVKLFSARNIHLVSLLAGGAGLASAAFVTEPSLLLVSMVFVGVAWASILSMPYAMLSNVIPAEKMGFYMGVFNFFIVIPQIIASLGLGLLVRHFLGGDGINAIVLGGAAMIIAALTCLLVGRESETGSAPTAH
ncbi:MAG: MFS transporter, partial [Chthoniobacterales bacterium]